MLLQRDVLFLKYCEDCFDVKGCGGSPSSTAICGDVLDGLRRMMRGAPLSLGAKAFVSRKKSRVCGGARFGLSGYSVASRAI